MQLGLTYRDAGKVADAQQTFNRLVEEYPDSPFSARRASGSWTSLKKTQDTEDSGLTSESCVSLCAQSCRLTSPPNRYDRIL